MLYNKPACLRDGCYSRPRRARGRAGRHTAVQLAGRMLHHQDRNRDSGKSRGGGLCVFIHNDWCSQSTVIDSYCSPDIETLSVMHRPFYLPRELTAVVTTAVYIPPDANTNAAVSYLYDIINKQQRTYPLFTSLPGTSTRHAWGLLSHISHNMWNAPQGKSIFAPILTRNPGWWKMCLISLKLVIWPSDRGTGPATASKSWP